MLSDGTLTFNMVLNDNHIMNHHIYHIHGTGTSDNKGTMMPNNMAWI